MFTMSTGSLASLEDGSGAVYWPAVKDIARQTYLNADAVQLLKERLKSEATHIVLNTLTALHTISLNGSRQVRDQLAISKCMKHLERLLNKPPFPGVEMAAAQLLIDWAFLFGADDLGNKSFHVLTSTSKHRTMIQGMQASDVAVMLREDQRLGMPRFVSVVKGLDFGNQFATQFARPLTGAAEQPSVLSRLAAAAVTASYSGSSAAAAAAAAASQNTFAAWAERVKSDPKSAAQQVLGSRQQMEADIAALSAAQAAVLAAARPFLKQSGSNSNLAAAAAAAASADYTQLRHELDRAYLVACKVTEWREMMQVLLQQQLPDVQVSSLLSLADVVNVTLEEWSAAATTELFWLLGVNTAGLADGSLLRKIVPAAAADSAAAAGSNGSSSTPSTAAAGQTGSRQQQQQHTNFQGNKQGASSFTTRSSYLDLLTGDALPPSSSTTNPFLTTTSSTVTAMSTPQQAATAGINNPDHQVSSEPHKNWLEAAASPASTQDNPASMSSAPQQPAAAAAAAAAGYQSVAAAPAAFPAVSAPSAGTASAVGLYPAVPQPLLQQQQQQYSSHPQHEQQAMMTAQLTIQPGLRSNSSTGTQQQQQQYTNAVQQQLQHPHHWQQQSSSSSGFAIPGLSPSQQRPPNTSASNVAAVMQPAAAGETGLSRISSTSSSSMNKPVSTDRHAVALHSSSMGTSTPIAAAAAGGGRGAQHGSNVVVAGDTGSSTDSPSAGSFSYINPFASLDTSTIVSRVKPARGQSSADGASAAGSSSSSAASKVQSMSNDTAAIGGGGVAVSLKQHSSNTDNSGHADGTSSSTTAAPTSHPPQEWQQQQHALVSKREPPSPLSAAAAAAAAAPPMHFEPVLQPVPHQQSQPNCSSSFALHDTAAAAVSGVAGQQQRAAFLQPPQIEFLQHKLQQVLSSCRSNSSQCQACSLPDAQALQAGLLQLLMHQQLDFEGRLQQLQQKQQTEVADLKATAVRRFKELQLELEQAKQQQLQPQD